MHLVLPMLCYAALTVGICEQGLERCAGQAPSLKTNTGGQLVHPPPPTPQKRPGSPRGRGPRQLQGVVEGWFAAESPAKSSGEGIDLFSEQSANLLAPPQALFRVRTERCCVPCACYARVADAWLACRVALLAGCRSMSSLLDHQARFGVLLCRFRVGSAGGQHRIVKDLPFAGLFPIRSLTPALVGARRARPVAQSGLLLSPPGMTFKYSLSRVAGRVMKQLLYSSWQAH
jgi:hypothetical protein